MNHPSRPCASELLKPVVVRLLLASFSLFAVLLLSGCVSTTQEIHARLRDRGNFVNGRESMQGSDFAFVLPEREGIVVTEIDGKPFFIEYKSPVIWEAGKWIKVSSPINLGLEGALAIRPGKHTVKLRYEYRTPSLLFPSFDSSKGETAIEFIADPGHGYVIKPNLATDKNSGKFWNPTITDRDAK